MYSRSFVLDIFFFTTQFASLQKKFVCIFVSHLLLWFECYLSHNYNPTLPTVSSLPCPLTKSKAILDICWVMSEILPDILCDNIYWDTLCLPKSYYFLPYFLKLKMMVNRFWAISVPCPVVHCFFYYFFHFYKNIKIQNTFTNIILHKKIMKLKEEQKNMYKITNFLKQI